MRRSPVLPLSARSALSALSARSVVAALLALGALAGCGTDAGGVGGPAGSSGQQVTLQVFAAASLTETFTELGQRFEAAHPGTTVQLNFGPSSGLAEQIASGAPADVFASASPTNMDAVVRGGDAEDPKDFATNSMEIAVPPDNPAKIAGLADLARRGVKLALCQPQVPCGKVAAQVFSRARLTVEPATEEVDVKSVLTKVGLGEVDAGVVYVTDVQGAGERVRGIRIPAEQNASTAYPIAVLKKSQHAREAGEFVDLVLSAAGTRVLQGAGFESP